MNKNSNSHPNTHRQSNINTNTYDIFFRRYYVISTSRCPLSRTMISTGIITKLLHDSCLNSGLSRIMTRGLPRTGSTKLLLTYCPNADTSGISPQERISFRRIHPSSKMLLQIVRKKRPDKIFSSEYCTVWIFSVTALILWSSAV